MALLIRKLIENYHYFNEEIADPRTNGWFLVDKPWAIAGIIGFYLYFVQTLGPKLMERRKPFKLFRIMQIYNVVQILLSAYLLSLVFDLSWPKYFNFRCQSVDYSNSKRGIGEASGVYIYFVIKIVDLLDTMFFVLRKKASQVSFLHLYHHAGIVFGSWVIVKYVAGGQIVLIGIINSFVHLVMYSYYLITSLKMSQPWWKKYLTQLQLLQFFIVLVHLAQLYWQNDCGFPIWPTLFLIPQDVLIIALFGNFYYKEYCKKPKMQAKNALSSVNSKKE